MTSSIDWISQNDALPAALAEAARELAAEVTVVRPAELLARREAGPSVAVVDAALEDSLIDRLASTDATFLVAGHDAELPRLVQVLNRLNAEGILLAGDASAPDIVGRCSLRMRDHGRTATAKRELDATVARLRSQLAAVEASSVSVRASIDGATGLWDTVHLVERVEDELNRLGRYGTAFGVLAVITGSASLGQDVAFAQVLMDFVRRVDVCTRRGLGDFVVVCPNTDEPGMRRFAERLREAVDVAVQQGTLAQVELRIAVVAYGSGAVRSDTVLGDLAAAMAAA